MTFDLAGVHSFFRNNFVFLIVSSSCYREMRDSVVLWTTRDFPFFGEILKEYVIVFVQ